MLNYATTDYGKAAERVIDNKGLNVLFGIFMGKTKVKGVKPGSEAATQETEHVMSIFANMFQHVVSRCALLRVIGGWKTIQMFIRCFLKCMLTYIEYL